MAPARERRKVFAAIAEAALMDGLAGLNGRVAVDGRKDGGEQGIGGEYWGTYNIR